MKGPDLGDSDILKLTDESNAFFLHKIFSNANNDLVLPQGTDSLDEIATARIWISKSSNAVKETI